MDIQEDIIYVSNKEQLPTIGDQTLVYKVGNDSTLYQWDATEKRYEPLGGGIDEDEILLISGGNAK